MAMIPMVCCKRRRLGVVERRSRWVTAEVGGGGERFDVGSRGEIADTNSTEVNLLSEPLPIVEDDSCRRSSREMEPVVRPLPTTVLLSSELGRRWSPLQSRYPLPFFSRCSLLSEPLSATVRPSSELGRRWSPLQSRCPPSFSSSSSSLEPLPTAVLLLLQSRCSNLVY
ncbi:hypothetical protein LINPERPRIM_LOCUS24570 [Linum perenne]